MLTVSEALEKILNETKAFSPIEVPLEKTLGFTLAEKVISDRDNPPFNKALMDGYAIREEDILEGHATLEVIEEVTAGMVPSKKVLQGQTARIMTGAPLPEGADLVVPFEEAELIESIGQETTEQGLSEKVFLNASKIYAGANMMPQGTVLKKRDTVLEQGAILDFQKLGALAEIGKSKVQVHRCPTVSVLATGDELVEVTAIPKEGQIRNSNETMLAAQIENAGAIPNRLGIAKDIQDEIESKIIQGLQSDILLLSGGVSAGTLDLVPSALKKCGVKEIFHKVKLKPGKPVWFGVYQKEDDLSKDSNGIVKKCFVFGLPGNPVGSMVCFELFVRAAIRSLKGMDPLTHPTIQAKLKSDYSMKGDRKLYHPCYLENVSGMNQITLLNWQGSADLQSTVNANAMAVFPSGDHKYSVGDFVDVMLWS